MKKLTTIPVLTMLMLSVFVFVSCQVDTKMPEEVVKIFLEGASYADIDTMKANCVGKMREELMRDEQAIMKLVYFERQKSIETQEDAKELVKMTDNREKSTRFSFSYEVLSEQTKIDPQERAEVWVLLSRKNVSITRSYDLVWADGKWLIENYTNQVGG